MTLRCLPAAFLLSASLAAQVPTDSIVTLMWYPDYAPSTLGANRIFFIDPTGGGISSAYVPFFWMDPLAAIAVDPSGSDAFWLADEPGGILDAVFSVPVASLAVTNPSGVASYFGGSRVRLDATRVWSLSNGAIQFMPKGGGALTTFVSMPDAVDIAVRGNSLFVAQRNAASPGIAVPLVEVDLTTSVQRTIGVFANVRRLAARGDGARLAIATDAATGPAILEIDVATGSVLSATATATPAAAVAYTSGNVIVHAENLAAGFVVKSSLAANGIAYSRGEGIVVDLEVSSVRTASVMPFRHIGPVGWTVPNCGNAGVVTWEANGLPRLGNSNFGISIANAPPSSVAALFLGASRVFSSVHQTALPMDLAPFGLGGCVLLVDPLVPIVLSVDAAGNASQALPIANSPALAGVEFVGQAFVADPSLPPLRLAATTGIAMKLNP